MRFLAFMFSSQHPVPTHVLHERRRGGTELDQKEKDGRELVKERVSPTLTFITNC